MTQDFPLERVTIIGLGLIGGSLAMAVKERFPDWHVQGVDPNAETLQYALKHGVINQASLTLPERFEPNHLIILACHLSASLETLKALAPRVQGQSILVTDIGSCKQAIAELGQALLPEQFIAGHPMAGKEFSGIQHATPLLFAGKPYLLCPSTATPEPLLEQLQAFVRGVGAMPKRLDAARHDQIMAYVSHLPQLYAVLLTNLLYRNKPGQLVAYHGAGLDDQLRLAASPYHMWGEILFQNSDNMVSVLSELRDIIDEMLPILRQEPQTEGQLEAWFGRANEMARQFHSHRAGSVSGGSPLL